MVQQLTLSYIISKLSYGNSNLSRAFKGADDLDVQYFGQDQGA